MFNVYVRGEVDSEIVLTLTGRRNGSPQIVSHLRFIQLHCLTNEHHRFYAKMPEDIAERWVLLLDPMLGTDRPSCLRT